MLTIIPANDMLSFYNAINKVMFTKIQSHIRGYQKLHLELIGQVAKFGKFNLTLSNMGYTQAKMNNLLKHYTSEENEIEFFKQQEKALDIDQYSCFFSTVGEAKGDHKKPHCIRGIGVNYVRKKQVNIHVFYRSSELSRKFLADLVFFNEYLWPTLGLSYDIPVFFHFTCCYVHAKQFPQYAVIATETGYKCFDFQDEKFLKMIKSNIEDVLEGKVGFGLLKTTNKVFRQKYKESDKLREYIRTLE